MGSKLLDLLERDSAFRSFTFDGHTIAVEDYLEKRPDDRPRIEALVRAERLLIGPWYVLADNLLVSGESLLRNFQEGLRVAASFGRAMRVGYVADPFGHPAQTPQLLRGFGYSTYVFSRGVGDEGERVGAEFRWQAPSGDRVLATHLVDHYSGGLALVGDLTETPQQLRARVRRRLGRLLRQNHPHDSICGCSIDAVHDVDMAPRFLRVRTDGEALAARLARELVPSGTTPVVWSSVPWERDAVVALDGTPTRVRCAALGTAPARRADGPGVASPEDGVIENEALRVDVALDGSFTVIDRL